MSDSGGYGDDRQGGAGNDYGPQSDQPYGNIDQGRYELPGGGYETRFGDAPTRTGKGFFPAIPRRFLLACGAIAGLSVASGAVAAAFGLQNRGGVLGSDFTKHNLATNLNVVTEAMRHNIPPNRLFGVYMPAEWLLEPRFQPRPGHRVRGDYWDTSLLAKTTVGVELVVGADVRIAWNGEFLSTAQHVFSLTSNTSALRGPQTYDYPWAAVLEGHNKAPYVVGLTKGVGGVPVGISGRGDPGLMPAVGLPVYTGTPNRRDPDNSFGNFFSRRTEHGDFVVATIRFVSRVSNQGHEVKIDGPVRMMHPKAPELLVRNVLQPSAPPDLDRLAAGDYSGLDVLAGGVWRPLGEYAERIRGTYISSKSLIDSDRRYLPWKQEPGAQTAAEHNDAEFTRASGAMPPELSRRTAMRAALGLGRDTLN